MKQLWVRMLPGDRVVVLLLLAICTGLILLQLGRAPGRTVVAEIDGKVVFTAPLDGARRVDLNGPLGKTELQIAAGEARILASPCPNKICIGMGAISRSNELLACVPNRLLVRIEGGDDSAERSYDLLSR